MKAELQIVNARLLRLEEGLHEAQQIMLAMQVVIASCGLLADCNPVVKNFYIQSLFIRAASRASLRIARAKLL